MKNVIWPIVILVIAVLFALLSRYELIVQPPVVVKMNQFTGDTWIVNSGYWVKVKETPARGLASETVQPVTKTGKNK